MSNSFITRRFIRIKALQYLYGYTIAQQAHKEKAIEQIKTDFLFDCFVHEPVQKAQLQQKQTTAVALFRKTIAKEPFSPLFPSDEESTIGQSVHNNLLYYRQACIQDQTILHKGWNQSKAYICMDYLYILLLLIEWHKMAKAEVATGKLITGNASRLKEALAQHALLAQLYHRNHWKEAIPSETIHWPIAEDCVQAWYRQLLQSAEPSKLLADAAGSIDTIELLECMVQTIIFNNKEVDSFFEKIDIYWSAHASIVKQLLTSTFKLLAAEGLAGFVSFWRKLEARWEKIGSFYDHLVQFTLQDNALYEAMIGEAAKKWTSERMVLLDKLMLKLALTELRRFEEIPMKVSINEYIEIAKLYGTAKSASFVNGMLEELLKKVPAGRDG
ncbi:transcription antitermination protein NusB [Candidatus Cardinium hertigii]|uniref:Transcription antitermination protein NusB n=1 Tax=Candidatus Cardinium hertigii TaxID=247481 RepID=A0A2Z3L6Y1_9BACT|nr:transcription antitermination protein NusB [Candidatus Cardinium hertigii]AWN81427.1 Transcription antitermination protein NusB [Candidatus Cardinium hertigii]